MPLTIPPNEGDVAVAVAEEEGQLVPSVPSVPSCMILLLSKRPVFKSRLISCPRILLGTQDTVDASPPPPPPPSPPLVLVVLPVML